MDKKMGEKLIWSEIVRQNTSKAKAIDPAHTPEALCKEDRDVYQE